MSDFRTIVKIKAHFSKIFTQLLGKIKKVVKFFFFLSHNFFKWFINKYH